MITRLLFSVKTDGYRRWKIYYKMELPTYLLLLGFDHGIVVGVVVYDGYTSWADPNNIGFMINNLDHILQYGLGIHFAAKMAF